MVNGWMDGKQEERESQVMTGVLYSLVCYYVLIHVLLFSVIVTGSTTFDSH